jgi:hypothetical protein
VYGQVAPLINQKENIMITHIVLFKLADVANVAATAELLRSMKGQIAELRHLEVGSDVLHTERSYDIALVTRFDSLEALQAYQVHPYHAGTVVPHMKTVCSSIVAVDYES